MWCCSPYPMSCPSCKLPTDPPEDSLGCDKCKKKYHWECTNLEKYLIKLHKKNPYKPWRCEPCTDKYCIGCEKIFPIDCQDAICCDRCNFWYHPLCSGLNENEYDFHCKNPTSKWSCNRCINKFCKKCTASVFHKAKITCCVCKFPFHMSCVKVPTILKNDDQYMKNCICLACKPTVFPFASVDNKIVVDMSNHKLEKYSRDNLSTNQLSKTCSMCEGSLCANNKGLPCSSCNSKIHVKCAKIDPKTFHIYKGNWQCKICVSNNFPFTEIESKDLIDYLAYNSNEEQKTKKFKPIVGIEDKLKLMLSYSKNSPWYAYTHPNEQEHDFFTAELEESMTMRPNFDYYDIDQFRRVKNTWNKKKSIGIFHTNIFSLQKKH